MQAAVEDVKKNGMSLRKAATIHNVSCKTLSCHVRGLLKGYPVHVLSEDEEQALSLFIAYNQDRDVPLTTMTVKVLARSIVERSGRQNNMGENGPTSKWLRNFLKHHPNLHVAKSKNRPTLKNCGGLNTSNITLTGGSSYSSVLNSYNDAVKLKYKRHSKENLKEAVEDVNNGMSVTKAAAIHNVARKTVRRHAKGLLLGYPVRALSNQEEEELCVFLTDNQELQDVTVTPTIVKQIAKAIIESSGRPSTVGENGPSDKWMRSFLKRHPNLPIKIWRPSARKGDVQKSGTTQTVNREDGSRVDESGVTDEDGGASASPTTSSQDGENASSPVLASSDGENGVQLSNSSVTTNHEGGDCVQTSNTTDCEDTDGGTTSHDNPLPSSFVQHGNEVHCQLNDNDLQSIAEAVQKSVSLFESCQMAVPQLVKRIGLHTKTQGRTMNKLILPMMPSSVRSVRSKAWVTTRIMGYCGWGATVTGADAGSTATVCPGRNRRRWILACCWGHHGIVNSVTITALIMRIQPLISQLPRNQPLNQLPRNQPLMAVQN